MDRRSETTGKPTDRLASSPWGARPPRELLFGRMHEDWTVEARLFPAPSRVFCIASAGCTALALGRLGHEVTAVDVNPAQVAYAQQRLEGAPPTEGRAERLLRQARRLLPLLGLSERRRREFLLLSETEAQIRYWNEHLARIIHEE